MGPVNSKKSAVRPMNSSKNKLKFSACPKRTLGVRLDTAYFAEN